MNAATPDWFDEYGAILRENGYSSPPEATYRAFIKYVRNNGKILELGCGNGLLLKYVCEHSSRILIPFGIDIKAAAIDTARAVVHPDRGFAFEAGDVARYRFPHAPYQTIIANPLYVNKGYIEQDTSINIITKYYDDNTVTDYVGRCFGNVAAGGRLILWCYVGQLMEIKNYRNLLFEHINIIYKSSFSEEPTICVWTMDKPA